MTKISYMKRDILFKLLSWKTSARRKPLILAGARQVGKTYILKIFAQQQYEDCIYLNFEENSKLAQFFDADLKPQNILQTLSIYFEKEIKPEKTLLIFDEIQECPNALNSLKYFNEQANDFHVIAAGSLLGIKLAHFKGFPVGKVNFLNLYPLNFFEFLGAMDKLKLRHYLEQLNKPKPIPTPFHNELIDLLKKYLLIGGMPEAVETYRKTQDLKMVREVHQEILKSYILDFAKHASIEQLMKISAVWESIPTQLAKENKKFIFSAIRKSARAREYEAAIQWLIDAGLIYKSYNISTPKLPLEAYCDKKSFKVFLLDVGLLGAMSNIPPRIIVENKQLFSEHKGAFTENFVAQELVMQDSNVLYYWTSTGMAEIDFILTDGREAFPLEVKAGISKKKKSLHVYAQKYNPSVMLRAALMNLKKDGNIINYPLYLVSLLFKFEAL